MKPAILLIHGFTSHRSSLEGLVPEIEKRGMDWAYPILAGHGTSPKDLEDKRWPDWQADIEQAYTLLRQDHDQVFVVALSMGSLLALELAASHPDHVAGLALIAPCLKFKARLSRYTPVISRLVKTFPNPSITKFSSLQYAKKDQGYLWFPTAVFRSYWERTHNMEPIIAHVTCPTTIIHSRLDLVADPRGAQELYKLLPGPKELLWHHRSGHEMVMDSESEAVIQEVMGAIEKVSA